MTKFFNFPTSKPPHFRTPSLPNTKLRKLIGDIQFRAIKWQPVIDQLNIHADILGPGLAVFIPKVKLLATKQIVGSALIPRWEDVKAKCGTAWRMLVGGLKELLIKDTSPYAVRKLQSYQTDRRLEKYNSFTTTTPMGRVDDAVRRILSQKDEAFILELGAGDGNAARDLKDRFGSFVTIDNIALGGEVMEENRPAFLNDVEANLNEVSTFPRPEYDIILSIWGSSYYADNVDHTLGLIGDHLAPGGEAVLMMKARGNSDDLITRAQNHPFPAVSRALGIEISSIYIDEGVQGGYFVLYLKRIRPDVHLFDIIPQTRVLSSMIQQRALYRDITEKTRIAAEMGKAEDLEINVGYRVNAGEDVNTDWLKIDRIATNELYNIMETLRLPKPLPGSKHYEVFMHFVDLCVKLAGESHIPIKNFYLREIDTIRRRLEEAIEK